MDAPRPGDWTPITPENGAPKDRPVILGWSCGGYHARSAWWSDAVNGWVVTENSRRGTFTVIRGPAPTHWMDLPEPPAPECEAAP